MWCRKKCGFIGAANHYESARLVQLVCVRLGQGHDENIGMMKLRITALTRRMLVLIASGVILGLLPVGFSTDLKTGEVWFGPDFAQAGDGENDDDEDDDEDEDEEEEEDEDNSGRGNGGDDGPLGDNSGGDDGGGDDPAPRNITVRYSDGWTELILNGRYQLIDNLNRQVIDRQATTEDFNRMFALSS